MAILGALILIVVGLAVAAALLRGGEIVTVDLEWFTIRTEARVVFFAGAIALGLFAIGVWLLLRGLKRFRQRRSEVKGLRKRAETSEEAVRAERAAATPNPAQWPPTEGPDEHFDSAPRDR